MANRLLIAVIVPVASEPDIGVALTRLVAQHADEIIVAEASDAATRRALDQFSLGGDAGGVRMIAAPRGRAVQMNAGAAVARSDVLLFLHADTRLPENALDRIRDAVAHGALWGRFDVRLSGAHPAFRLIERCMNLRSAVTGIATGDQAIFVRADVFRLFGGFAPIALMEDIELCARLKGLARPYRIRAPVITSSRRWERAGIVRTILRMWLLRALYAFGVSPRRLAAWYR